MSEPIWKLMPMAPSQQVQSVWKQWEDGRQESCFVTSPEYLKWLEEGNTPIPADEENT
jgi:hypothetical protein